MRSNSIRVCEAYAVILKAVTEAAEDMEIEWFICGASARVFICEYLSEMRPGRATGDLDLGVCVDSLDEYDSLRNHLCERHRFDPVEGEVQRLVHNSGSTINIVPFGEFAGPGKVYRWGKDDRYEMNVLGFEEAHKSALVVIINGAFPVRVAGYAEQFGLKVLVWADRHYLQKDSEDAHDLAYFLRHAEEWYGLEFLHEEFPSKLENLGYDVELASAFVLGYDLARTFTRNTVVSIKSILEHALENRASALIQEISLEIPYRDPEDRTVSLVEQVLQGLLKG